MKSDTEDAIRYRWLRSHLEFINFSGLTYDTSDVGLDYAIDRVVELESAAPSLLANQQTSGPRCRKCGAFTTYARVDSHGMCMRCESAAKDEMVS